MFKKSTERWLLCLVATALLYLPASAAFAVTYEVDPTHSFVQFRIKHLGYSWLYGRFNTLTGEFTYDAEKPQASTITVEIDTDSVDTNHAERDKHLRGEDFLDVSKYPKATFKSTKFTPEGEGGRLEGELTLHGVTKPVTIDIQKIGEGKDPWGGYRAGFSGTTTLTRKDFGIDYDLGPAAETMELELGIEGIRK
jgi:polyisoprenoid-binding protein YceI